MAKRKKPEWTVEMVEEYRRDSKEIMKSMRQFRAKWKEIAKAHKEPLDSGINDFLVDAEADLSDFLELMQTLRVFKTRWNIVMKQHRPLEEGSKEYDRLMAIDQNLANAFENFFKEGK